MGEDQRDERLFKYDAFLSHRRGDGADALQAALAERGCTTFFDTSRPLADRRIMPVIHRSFCESRMVVAFVSDVVPPSPWTILEIVSAIETERKFGCNRLLVYLEGPNSAGLLDDSQMPPDPLADIQARKSYTPESIDALAEVLQQSNHERACAGARNGTQIRRNALARLGARISAFRQLADSVEVERGLDDGYGFEAMTIDIAEEVRQQVSEDPSILMRGTNRLSLNRLRNRAYRDLKDSSAAERGLLRGIASLFSASDNTDDRANALLLLGALAGEGDPAAQRFLRWRLALERDIDIVRQFQPDRKEQPWIPARLRGLERRLLDRAALDLRYISPDLEPLISPEIRLAVIGARHREILSESLLPDHLQIDLSIHQLNMLLQAVLEAHQKELGTDRMTGVELVPVDVELAFRDMQRPLSNLVRNSHSDAGILEETLTRILTTSQRIVAASERYDGMPLRPFSSFFADLMLPVLGLLILKLNDEGSELVALQAIATLERFVLSFPGEPCRAFIAKCVEWRRVHGGQLSAHSPVRFGVSGLIEIDSDILWEIAGFDL